MKKIGLGLIGCLTAAVVFATVYPLGMGLCKYLTASTAVQSISLVTTSGGDAVETYATIVSVENLDTTTRLFVNVDCGSAIIFAKSIAAGEAVGIEPGGEIHDFHKKQIRTLWYSTTNGTANFKFSAQAEQ